MFIATVPPGHRQLRRSGMFIAIATNNGLRKLRQERHGTIRLLSNPTCVASSAATAGMISSRSSRFASSLASGKSPNSGPPASRATRAAA